ncbi:MAG: hypothetical protein ACPGQD_07090, partial [Planctomycetota bacterium]
FSYLIVHPPWQTPPLLIRPEGVWDKLKGAIGFDDIDFESVDFSNAYTVRSRDRKLAFDFCHTGMMEYLLAHRGTALELEGNTLALFVDRRLEAADLDPLFRKAARLRELMPEYLFRD